jgi:HEAT repeat protein
VETAARCGGQRAVPSLVLLLKDVSWQVRHEVVKALGLLGGEAAVDGLCGVLKDRDRDVRESAVVALGKVGDGRAIRALVLALLDTENTVRTAADLALRRVDRFWEKTEAARDALPEIKAALSHREYWISHSAGKLLARIQAAAAETDTEFVSAPEPLAPASAPDVPHAAFAILADLLHDRDRDLRLAAAVAFGELREKGAASLLATAGQDDDLSVRLAAKSALNALN